MPTAKSVSVKINGKWSMKYPPHQVENFVSIDPERLSSMHSNLRVGDRVFDVGAGEGVTTGLISKWVSGMRCTECDYQHKEANPTPTYCARGCGIEMIIGGAAIFEPTTSMWPSIKKVWEANKLSPPLGWFVGFASDTTEEDPPNKNVDDEEIDGWPKCAYGGLTWSHEFKDLSQETDTTPQITLDEFADRINVRPSALIVDVSGSEWQVLRGAEMILTDDRPLVWCTIYETILDEVYAESVADFHSWLYDLDYRERTLTTSGDVHQTFFVPRERLDNKELVF